MKRLYYWVIGCSFVCNPGYNRLIPFYILSCRPDQTRPNDQNDQDDQDDQDDQGHQDDQGDKDDQDDQYDKDE